MVNILNRIGASVHVQGAIFSCHLKRKECTGDIALIVNMMICKILLRKKEKERERKRKKEKEREREREVSVIT
jgi:hypothetical protein